MSTTTNLRTLYRALLRELPPRPILSSPRAPLYQRLHESFSAPSPPITAAEAEQSLLYLRSQRMYATLLERYNPGMGMDQDERVRLSARKVGMDLPKEYGGEN
ncbi:hypothetical protein QBC39DRAFT_366171 [Podospora conica]|nr:hypothetical protein QBC39DRAFT_366171 [Schizothecium conicum]